MAGYKRAYGKRPKYGRKAYKSRLNRLQGNYVASPRTMVPSNKFYPGLSQNLYQMCEALADSRYTFDTFDTIPAQCKFSVIDTVNLSLPINAIGPTGSGKNWYYNQLINNLNTYQEARLKMTKFSIDMSVDCQTTIGSSTAISPTDRLDVALAVVPLAYIRTTTGVVYSLSDIGSWDSGVDYYSALTHMRGAKFFSLTTDGSKSNMKATFYIDGLAHNGVYQTVTSKITWIPTAQQPDATLSWPSSSERQVILIAIRYKTHNNSSTINEMNVRYSLRCQNSYHFTDIVPVWPYATATGII